MTGNGIRKTKYGYEAFVSNKNGYVYLGNHISYEDAEDAVFEYRAGRLVNNLNEYGLDVNDSVVFMNRYLAFSNGMIFNLHGIRMRGSINRDGYAQCVFNGKTIQIHRIIATAFCYRPYGKDYVNHLDGDKSNNAASNLEWVTRSENAIHSFRNGLQKSCGSGPLYTIDELDYIRAHCFDNVRDVALKLGRSVGSVKHYMYRYRKEFSND